MATFITNVVGVRRSIGLFFFRQVLYRDLGSASYVVGDGGEAVVVDPRWDIDVYVEIAREEGLWIAYILDTPDHADHVSGRADGSSGAVNDDRLADIALAAGVDVRLQ
jgi:glyoxylase-like metal-dependent hydrolase (beta-lactamase superfamily II)